MRRFGLPAILLSFLLMSCTSLPAGAQSGEPAFLVSVENKDDQVNVQYENGVAILEVYSPGGIGSAALTSESGDMPKEILLRLHLKGLEKFRITSGERGITASISSSDPLEVPTQTIVSHESETPIQSANPLWLKIEIVSTLGEKKIPLEEGYFEITVPKDFIREIEHTFRIEWIDFYR